MYMYKSIYFIHSFIPVLVWTAHLKNIDNFMGITAITGVVFDINREINRINSQRSSSSQLVLLVF